MYFSNINILEYINENHGPPHIFATELTEHFVHPKKCYIGMQAKPPSIS